MKFTLALAAQFTHKTNPNAVFILVTMPEDCTDVIYRVMDYTYTDEYRTTIGMFNQTIGTYQDYDNTIVTKEYFDLVMS